MTRPNEYPRMEGPESYDDFNADEAKQDRIRRLVTTVCVVVALGLVAVVAVAVKLAVA